MYYCLNNNTYLVEGKSKDCIYDLKNKKLYHIQKAFSALIERACAVNIDELNLIDEENKAIENLKNAGLLGVSDEIKQFPDIKNLDTDFRACSHKNSIKNHSEHDDSKKNDIEFIITSENFSETF